MARGCARFLGAPAMLAAAVLVTGCSGRGSAERVSADAPIAIDISQAFVTFHNKTGSPVTAVTITLLPYGPGEFTRRLPRVENTMKRDVPLNEFRSRDGTPLNLRVTRLKTVRVRAEDVTGKTHELDVPWQ